MARTSLAPLITRLREMTSADVDEFTLDSQTYFSDDHLQAVLEAHSTHHSRAPLYPIGEFINAEMVYRRYPLPYYLIWLEGAGDDSAYLLVDGTGASAPAHTVNTDSRQVIFDAPTDGRTFYLSGQAYDLHLASAHIWRQKAAHVAKRVTFSVDGQAVSASDYHAHCIRMATYYDTLTGATMARRVRMDEV